jgi:K+-transporting ATPase ATPase C chain
MTTFLRRVLWPGFALLLVMTMITGVAYPAVVTAVAQVAFPHQANGSMLVAKDGRTVGSSLIGQAFSGDTYFWGRLSAAGATDANPLGYDASGSAGSNLGPTNQDLLDRVEQSVADYQSANPGQPVPVDLITTSASGLDPDISPASAEYQVARVAAARGTTADAVRAIVSRHTEEPLFGLLGEPRVHVLELNLDLDGLLQ